ncbi:MAG: biosynthetic-type acetolactate synthase large subunit [Synergistaceae bacterium]|nr:biosynthetic-type acetolactate synthase large subunit [Synergistaceae bacterium]
MKMNGAQMVVKALELEGVRCVFGIPGGSVIPLYDALYDAPFPHILVRHEQGAAHAADGYARVTGEPGVCICTSGPGFTNILTGLATAFLDSIPMVAITGQVSTTLIGTDAFQEADTFGSSLPTVKHSILVRSVEEIPGAIRGAFELAVSGRPGPVLIDLPVDIQRAEGEFVRPEGQLFSGHHRKSVQDISRLGEAVELLKSSLRPVILAGGGIISSGAAPQLLRLAEKMHLPAATTLMGKGAFPETHPLSLGMAGMHGTPGANTALSEADVIVAVGARFSDRTTGKVSEFAKNAAVIHLDLDDAEIDKIVGCAVALVGDAASVLERLTDELPEVSGREWADYLRERVEAMPLFDPGESAFVPSAIFRAVQLRAHEQAIAVTDVGQNQMWAALFWKSTHPRTFLTSGGLGTMGYALPAAMGASLARGKTPVLCFAGDGGFMMNIQELETCARYNIPVKIVLLNNSCLGMVRQWQELFWGERYAATTQAPACNFSALAEAFGVPARSCSTLGELEAALDDLFETPGPALLDCSILREELVMPMVPAGAALKEFMYRVKV